MLKYILKRLALMLMNILIVMLILFVLIRLLPINLVASSEAERQQLMDYYNSLGCTYHYNSNGVDMVHQGDPILQQFFKYLGGIITGWDWGMSAVIKPGFKVTEIIGSRLPVTISLNIWSFVICVPIGILLGVFAALKKNKWEDHFISILVIVFISVPGFVLSMLLQYVVAFKWDLLPLTYETENVAISSILPIAALSFGPIASLTRYTRAELTEVLTGEFMLLARTKGLTRGQATIRHALRNSMVPVMPIIIWNFVSILSGSYIIERIFSIPGIGDLFIKSITGTPPDYDVFMTMGMFYVSLSFLGTLLVDLSYGVVDPRIRIGGKK